MPKSAKKKSMKKVATQSVPKSAASPRKPSFMPRSSLKVQLLLEARDLKPSLKRWLDAELKRIAALAGITRGSITLVVVDDRRMSEMHDEYKGDPTTTDVLTFDLRDSSDEPLEGDIVLCLDEAGRQARERGHDTRTELLLYAVHGLLHLMGFDDIRAADYRKMHAKEDELFQLAGYGKVFAK